MTGLFEQVVEIGGVMVFITLSIILAVFHNGVIRNIYLGEEQKRRWFYWAYLVTFLIIFGVFYSSIIMLFKTIIYKAGMWSPFSKTLLFVSLLVGFGLHMWIMKHANDARTPPKTVQQKGGPVGVDGGPTRLETMPSRALYWSYVSILGIVSLLVFRLFRTANRSHALINPGKGFQLYGPLFLLFGIEVYHLWVMNDIYAEPIPPKESQVGGKYGGYVALTALAVVIVSSFVLQKGKWIRSIWERMKMEPKYNPIYDRDPTQPEGAQHLYFHQSQQPPENIFAQTRI